MQRSGKFTLVDLLGVGTLLVFFGMLMPLFTKIVGNTLAKVGPFLGSLLVLIPMVLLAIPVMLVFTSQVKKRGDRRRRRRRQR